MKFSLTRLALKVSVLVAGLGASTPLLSDPYCPFNGFYAGVMGGALQSTTEFSRESSAQYENFFHVPGLISSGQKDVKVYRWGGAGALNLGYGEQVGKCMFIAGEIFVSAATRDTSVSDYAYTEHNDQSLFDSFNTSLKAKTSASTQNVELAIDLRPGFLVNSCTLLYGRVGVGFNKLRTKNRVDFEYNGREASEFVGHSVQTLSTTKKSNKSALRLGLGCEWKLCPNLSLTSDYIYSYYGKAKTQRIADSTFANGEDDNFIADGFKTSSSAKMATQAFLVGIKYYFDNACCR
ncbi:outer membrane protein [Estrella lausannensis]|uniref:Outer membrane protein n=1 Tax=Estrella lausannensis TaxID=483423 RepID=A0A0H5E5W6_9BACT|nr:outer membrane beta-barrel protein [Estrella lausannensis]CRX38620.1 Outer membrane protein [Estrella lausannensis]